MGANVVAYSLPRLITMGIQCTFCTYFWELYTGEFGWTAAEYGTVSSLYSFTQIFSFIGLGFIFKYAIEDGCKNDIDKKRDWSIGILVGGTMVHWLTYFLLIFLPIKWHGVKTPFMESLFGKTSHFRIFLFKGPINLSDLIVSKEFGMKIREILTIAYFPFRVCWTILYPFMKIFWIVIHIKPRGKNVINTAKIDPEIQPVLATLREPTCSACCNTTCCNNFAMRMRHARQFMGTRTFGIYMLVVAHGVGVSAHELSNKALESYAFSNAAGSGAINVNLSFFFISNLFVYVIFSLAKFYIRSRAFFAETFYLLSAFYLALCIPFIPGFIIGTRQETGASGGTETPELQHYLILASVTIFHSTILFWLFSCGPLTFYLSVFILDRHVGIGSFGILIFNVGLTGASWVNMIADVSGANVFPKRDAHRIIATVCIICELAVFLVFYRHNWWWNKGNWFNYVLLVFIGIVNTLFVGYTNLMLGNLASQDNVKKWKWIAFGIFYGVTNAVVSQSMLAIFRSFGKDEIRYCGCKCLWISYRYSFPSVYKRITALFIVLNGIALGPIWDHRGYITLS